MSAAPAHSPPDRPLAPRIAWLARARPAFETLGWVALMLGMFMLAITLLIAWIRTPEGYFISSDPRLPHVVRGGESLSALWPWLRSALAVCGLLIGTGTLCLTSFPSLTPTLHPWPGRRDARFVPPE